MLWYSVGKYHCLHGACHMREKALAQCGRRPEAEAMTFARAGKATIAFPVHINLAQDMLKASEARRPPQIFWRATKICSLGQEARRALQRGQMGGL